MIRLLLIRHAATDASEKGQLLGATDAAAAAAGLERVARLPSLLAQYSPDAWYCSPMNRAIQTIDRLAGYGCLNKPYRSDERLREIDFGRWEQKSFAEIRETDSDLIPAWSRYEDFVFPEGEAVKHFTGRVAEMLGDLCSTGDRVIGVVTHGGVIRTMICHALGLDPRNYLLFSVDPASLTILDLYEDGGVLGGLNI